MSPRESAPLPLVAACVALALLLHAGLVLSHGLAPGQVVGGGDLLPHLRLIELTRAAPGLHNPYAPAYHGLGALLAPWVGLERYPALFALAAAALLLAGFRAFQRAAGLPGESTALFALTPYLLSLSWCTPRVEAAGYGLLLFGLAALLRRRYATLALLLAADFAVHTASALLFGLSAGVLALARRDRRGLLALALGSLGALPLLAVHLRAGCSPAEAFLFASGGYARSLRESLLPANWPWLVPLAGPVALVAAGLGARAVPRLGRPLAVLCGVHVVLYLNNLWLAPFGLRTLVTPLRGLSLLAIPVAVAAGLYAAGSPARRRWVLGLAALFALVAAFHVVPRACFVRTISLSELRDVSVSRCTFQWRAPPPRRGRAPGPTPALPLAGSASEGLVVVRFGPGGSDLWRVRLRDGAAIPLLETPDRDELWPFWSAAAERLVYQVRPSARESWKLVLLDRQGRERPVATPGADVEHWAAWSPDGRRLVYAFGRGGDRGLAEIELATGARTVHLPGGAGAVLFRPEYAPDGRTLVAQLQPRRSHVPSRLWVLGPGRPPQLVRGLGPFVHKARFTRDGAWLVLTRRSAPGQPGDLMRVRPDGSELEELAALPGADEGSARPSPTRDEVAFISDRSGSPDLYLLDLATRRTRRLVASAERHEAAPRWSPDGERIAISVLARDAHGQVERAATRVAVVDRSGRILLETPGTMPDWMPPWASAGSPAPEASR